MSIREDQWRKVIAVMRKLDEVGCLEHVMLVGSWADYLYSASGVLPDYESRIRTLDLDFLIHNIRRPAEKKNAIELFEELGFIVESDRMTNVTKLLDPETGFEVEFLVQQMGSGTEQYMKTNLGVTAQALRHFNILVNNKMTIDYLGMKILVPKPEAFAIHKMVINSDRRPAKALKDQEAIKNMYPYLDKEIVAEIREGLSKKDKKLVDAFIEKTEL